VILFAYLLGVKGMRRFNVIKKSFYLFAFATLIFLNFSVIADSNNWNTEHKNFHVTFDKSIWKKMIEKNTPVQSFYVLIHKRLKGVALLLLRETSKNFQNINREAYEQFLFGTLKNKSPKSKITGKEFKLIAGKKFRLVSYSFNNPKFGKRRVKHVYFKEKNTMVTMMMMWPEKTVIKNNEIAPSSMSKVLETIKLVK